MSRKNVHYVKILRQRAQARVYLCIYIQKGGFMIDCVFYELTEDVVLSMSDRWH
jgi:hypothetical protein